MHPDLQISEYAGLRWLRRITCGVAVAALGVGLVFGSSTSCTYKTTCEGCNVADSDGGAVCRKNSDCDDGRACSGVESCRGGTCASGTPMLCDTGSECVDVAGRAECRARPDSAWLAYGVRRESGEGSLFALNVSGAQPASPVRIDVSLGAEEVFKSESLAWSPDGHYLAFATENRAGGAEAAAAGVYVVDMLRESAPAPNRVLGAAISFQWSPDSSRILVQDSAGSFYVVTLNGPNAGRAVRVSDRFPQGTASSWSPTGNVVAIRSDKLFVVDVNADPVAAPSALHDESSLLTAHRWSPDGQSLLFEVEARGAKSLWQAVPPAASERLASGSLSEMSWSPDSKHLVYVDHVDSTSQLRFARNASSASRSVSTPSVRAASPFCWSPDSTAFSYVESTGAAFVYEVATNSGKKLELTVDPRSPVCWSPRGKFLSLRAKESTQFRLVVVLTGEGYAATDGGGGGDASLDAAPAPGVSTSTRSYIDAVPTTGTIIGQFAPDDSGLWYVKSEGTPSNQDAAVSPDAATTGEPNALADLSYVDLRNGLPRARLVEIDYDKRGIAPLFSAGGGYLSYTAGPNAALFFVKLQSELTEAPTPLIAASGITITDVAWQPLPRTE
jgi:Tol biopolymer transport system component